MLPKHLRFRQRPQEVHRSHVPGLFRRQPRTGQQCRRRGRSGKGCGTHLKETLQLSRLNKVQAHNLYQVNYNLQNMSAKKKIQVINHVNRKV